MTTAVNAPDASARADGSPILVAENVTMRFGGLVAVNSVDLHVNKGEIMGLIGPNGAGKTTFFNCLTGLYLPTAGRVVFNGAELPPKPRKVVIAGMARTFQNIRLFGNMTALENVMVGRYCRTTTGPLTSILRGPKFRRDEKATRNPHSAFRLHASPRLRRRSHSTAMRPRSATNMAGVSHRSSCSVTVVPLVVYIMSRASASAVSGV